MTDQDIHSNNLSQLTAREERNRAEEVLSRIKQRDAHVKRVPMRVNRTTVILVRADMSEQERIRLREKFQML